MTHLLEIHSLSKTFGGEQALVDAHLTLDRGEIRGLVGANGSGKSTLVKLLAGYHTADATPSSIKVDGQEVDPEHDRGISGFRFIHQDLGLVPELSVRDNLAIDPSPFGALLRPLRLKSERRQAQRLIDDYGLTFSPRTLVRDLGASDRTMVAVMRALRDEEHAKVLVLDEMTATLPPNDIDRVLAVVRRLHHCGVLFVSHRMEEVLGLCDTVTVLRGGRVVGDVTTAQTSENELVELITGRPVGQLYPHVDPPKREPVLVVNGLSGAGLRDVDLTVHRGEIVGLASLDPVQPSSLLRLIYGDAQRIEGDVRIGSVNTGPGWGPTRTMDLGVNLVTDRLVSAVPSFTLRENLTFGDLRGISGRWHLNGRAERLLAAELIDSFGIVPAGPNGIFAGLSGGNQQKAVLARSMRLAPKLLLLDDPTRGVDIGAKAVIYRILRDATQTGLAVLIASTDFEELASLSYRVITLKDGRVNGVLEGAACTEDHVLEQCYIGVEADV